MLIRYLGNLQKLHNYHKMNQYHLMLECHNEQASIVVCHKYKGCVRLLGSYCCGWLALGVGYSNL